MTNLLIVESPGKIKKIESLLGDDYKVIASVGHVIDLNSKTMSVDIPNQFNPIYICNPDKSNVIESIIKEMKKADRIYLATDEDREGEMIAWSLKYIAELKNKKMYDSKVADAKRITFNSITKSALLASLKNASEVNMNLVKAQQARRILDRIVGYELSPVLWSYGTLSAGRVQSVVTRLIVEKEKEISDFFEGANASHYTVSGLFGQQEKDSIKSEIQCNAKLFKKQDGKSSTLKLAKIKSLDKTKKIFKKLVSDKCEFKIESKENSQTTQSPPLPFTTSTLQQEASKRFGFSVQSTMQIAQKLYEAGLITYMRTDSVCLSPDATKMIENYVVSTYGDKYHQKRVFTNKGANVQEAHEACRCTDVTKTKIDKSDVENKLYNLIWKRTVGSQMAKAVYDNVEYTIGISTQKKYKFVAEDSILTFDGFLILDNKPMQTSDNKLEFNIDDKMDLVELNGKNEMAKPPSRYNEASLINKLDPKHLNIGRPATYASIIHKIQERKYVEVKDSKGKQFDVVHLSYKKNNKEIEEKHEKVILGADKKRFVPTDLGIKVTNLLLEHFKFVMEYEFTADMEVKLDQIAEGKLVWHNVLQEFYSKFHPLVIKIMEVKKAGNLITHTKQFICILPNTTKEINLITIKNKPTLICGEKKEAVFCDLDCEPADLTPTHAIELVTKKMEYPKVLGKHEKKDVVLKMGFNNSFYIQYQKINISCSDTITFDEAVDLIKDKQEKEKTFVDDDGTVYKTLIGQYGPYINVSNKKTKKSRNVKLDNNVKLKLLTLESVKEIVANYKPKSFKGKSFRKTVDSTTKKSKATK